MPHLSPSTLTASEQTAILAATRANPRDHLIYSLALGTGLRLAEIVGLNVGDMFAPDGTPRTRVRIPPRGEPPSRCARRRAPLAPPARGEALDYFRCFPTSLVISNMFTVDFPPNTAFSTASALIIRLFFGSCSSFFLM